MYQKCLRRDTIATGHSHYRHLHKHQICDGIPDCQGDTLQFTIALSNFLLLSLHVVNLNSCHSLIVMHTQVLEHLEL